MIRESPSVRGTKSRAADGETVSRRKLWLGQGDPLNGGRRTRKQGSFHMIRPRENNEFLSICKLSNGSGLPTLPDGTGCLDQSLCRLLALTLGNTHVHPRQLRPRFSSLLIACHVIRRKSGTITLRTSQRSTVCISGTHKPIIIMSLLMNGSTNLCPTKTTKRRGDLI